MENPLKMCIHASLTGIFHSVRKFTVRYILTYFRINHQDFPSKVNTVFYLTGYFMAYESKMYAFRSILERIIIVRFRGYQNGNKNR